MYAHQKEHHVALNANIQRRTLNLIVSNDAVLCRFRYNNHIPIFQLLYNQPVENPLLPVEYLLIK